MLFQSSKNFHGSYPPALTSLTPNYLKTLPLCPLGQKYSYEKQGEAYTIQCTGRHPGEAAGHPLYNSSQGLVTDVTPPRPTPDAMRLQDWKITGVRMTSQDRATVDSVEDLIVLGQPHQVKV